MDCVEFLLRAKILNENIEYIASKPFKVDIDIVPYDLPRELKEKKDKLGKYKTQK